MADFGEDVELGEVLLILLALGVGGYFLYKGAASLADLFKKKTTCVICDNAKTAVKTLKSGGSQIWSCGSDFDYAQPCGDVVQVRRASLWCQAWGTPVTYTTVPRNQYVRPSGGTRNPAFVCCYADQTPASAAGNPPCNGGKQDPCLTPCWNSGA